jgi:methionyl-tRNA formyltransferase
MAVQFDGVVDRRTLDDGDIITPEFLRYFEAVSAEQATQHGFESRKPPPTELARPSRADASVRAAARDWLAHRPAAGEAIADGEYLLLHAFETAAVTRPPATSRARVVDAQLCAIYLSLCHRWIELTASSKDPRFLNAALKIAAVSVLSGTAPPAAASAVLREGIDAIERLATAPPAPRDQGLRPQRQAPRQPLDHPVRVAVLAGADSRGVPRFQAAAYTAGVPITGILLYESHPDESVEGSYSEAWYPPRRTAGCAPARAMDIGPAVPTERIAHGDWGRVIARLRAWQIDLAVLLGMEILPSDVIAATTLGAINAHNGALPAFRGMDAVGWAVLAGAEPTATVHVVTPDVDAGDILSEQSVSLANVDLKESMKVAQITMLVEVCRTLTTTRALPPACPQQGAARRYYRMHPALKHLLDSRVTALAETTSGVRP